MTRRTRLAFVLSRLKGLLLAPGREWKVINDERLGRVTLFRDFIVLPCALLSLLVVLLRWTTADFSVALRWGVINLAACTAGCYVTFRVARVFLAAEIAEVTPVAFKLSLYTFVTYIPFRSLSMGFSSREFIGELLAVCCLYSIHVLYSGLGALASMDAARRRGSCFLVGLLVICLPWIFTRLLTIVFRVPINI
ncbi:MAG: hypothetical protein LBK12_05795 [Odoribacteraceae bacterium]|jgi:hypothetical protein|nr:hypothetical protein [Odoribacteraceae bacterium]